MPSTMLRSLFVHDNRYLSLTNLSENYDFWSHFNWKMLSKGKREMTDDIEKVETLKLLGLSLKKLRKKRGISQVVLCEDLGLNYRHYIKLENGQVDPRITTLVKLCKFYSVNIGALLDEITFKEAVDRKYFKDVYGIDFESFRESDLKKSYSRLRTDRFSICILDKDGQFLFANSNYEKLFRLEERNILGKSFETLNVDQMNIDYLNNFNEFIHKHYPEPNIFFYKVRLKNGEDLIVRTFWDYLKQDGEVIGVFCVLFDCSDFSYLF